MTALVSFCGEDRHRVSPAEARVVVLPAPYEATVSYGTGTARGPEAILEASGQLEMYDEELDLRIDAAGIVTLPPLIPSLAGAEATLARIAEAAAAPLAAGQLLVTLGGEHTVTVGVLQALRNRPGQTPPVLLQIDAHADLRQSYQDTPYSHACVMARAHELGYRFVQVGLRSLSELERGFLREARLEENVFWAHDLAGGEAANWIGRVLDRIAALGGEETALRELYITIDLDGLDPSIMPSTGTPEPGGLGWYPMLHLLRAAAQRFPVVGFDVTELAPRPGHHAPDFLAARLTYKLMGYALLGLKGHRPVG